MGSTNKVPATLPSHHVQLRPEGMYFLLVPSDQGCLVNNLIALCFDFNLLGSGGKLEGVVGFLGLAGSWRDCADDSNAGSVARQRALQFMPFALSGSAHSSS